MAREAFNHITEDSDSSIGSNGDPHIPTVTVPLVGAQLESESSSALAPNKHKPSKPSKKQKVVAEPPPPPPPSPPKPNETEIAASIQQTATSSRINSSNNNPVLNGVLSAECEIAGVTYSRPFGGGSKPRPLAGVTSSNPGAPDPVAVSSPQPQVQHPAGAAAQGEEYHQPPQSLTVDYLSRMEAAASSLVPPVQVQEENPPNNMFAQWGQTLSLGNEKCVDLSLRIGLRYS